MNKIYKKLNTQLNIFKRKHKTNFENKRLLGTVGNFISLSCIGSCIAPFLASVPKLVPELVTNCFLNKFLDRFLPRLDWILIRFPFDRCPGS